MAAATIIIRMRWCAAAIASCRSISTCPAARRPRRHCCTACCCCRRRSAAPVPSNAKGCVMDDCRLDALGQTIVSALPGAATGHTIAFNQLTVTVQAEKIVDVVRFLRDDPGCRFVNFPDVTAVDYPGREKRFEVIYHFLSPTLNERIRLRAEADETTQVPSIIA